MFGASKTFSFFSLIAVLGVATSCGSSAATKVYAVYMTGRVNIAGNVPVEPGVPIVVEYSTDGFATVNGSTKLNNDQGLLTLPYRVDFQTYDGDYVQLRAYQDSNGNGQWDPGESSGRYDDTATGNAAFLSIHRVVDYSCASGSYNASAGECTGGGINLFTSDGRNSYIEGADFSLDSTTGL